MGLATAIWIGFLIYGLWLCLRDWALREPGQAPQDDPHAKVETSIDSVKRQ